MKEATRKRLERAEADAEPDALKINFEALTDAELRIIASIPIRGHEVGELPPAAAELWARLERVVAGGTVYFRHRAPEVVH